MDILRNILNYVYSWAATSGIKILVGFILLFVGWKFIGKLIKAINLVLEKNEVDLTLRSFLDAFVNIALKVILVLVVMAYVGINTASLVALIGSAGLAIGLSLQGSLSNFAGGVIILFIRPFKIGDFIEVSAHSGVVENIGIFYTNILTYDNKQILIPNGKIANDSVINYTSQKTRRVDLKFLIGYEEDISEVKSIIEEIVKKDKLILHDHEYFIGLSEQDDKGISIATKVWTKTEDYWTVYFNILESVKVEFDKKNISIPYHQMQVNLRRK